MSTIGPTPRGLEIVDGVVCIKAQFPPELSVFASLTAQSVRLNRPTGEVWLPIDPDRIPESLFEVQWETQVDDKGHVTRSYRAKERQAQMYALWEFDYAIARLPAKDGDALRFKVTAPDGREAECSVPLAMAGTSKPEEIRLAMDLAVSDAINKLKAERPDAPKM